MNDNNNIEKAGEKFGDDIVKIAMTNRAFTVTILRVDEDYAYVTMTESTEEMPVPLTGINITQAAFKITPKVESLAVVQFADSAENQPFFVAFSDIDSISLTVGTATVEVSEDTWTFNGGELGGVTKAQELKTQLDKLTARVDGIINAIENGVPAPTDGGLAYQTTMKVILATLVNKEDFSDIENTKIKQ